MQKKFLVVLLPAIPLVLSGCARYWYQEDKSFEESSQARQDCRVELLRRTDLENMNDHYENEFMEDCMSKKGYRSVGQGDLPLDVKRQGPDTSLHWRLRGVAGTIEKP